MRATAAGASTETDWRGAQKAVCASPPDWVRGSGVSMGGIAVAALGAAEGSAVHPRNPHLAKTLLAEQRSPARAGYESGQY